MSEPIEPNYHNIMNGMAKALDEVFNGQAPPPPIIWQRKVGFCLFVFEFGKTDNGRVNYISNAERAEMITAVKEWLGRAEGRVSETSAEIQ
jgi:hypothetical protein